MKRFFKLTGLILVLVMSMQTAVFAQSETAEPQITASAGVVMDYATGEILYEKDMNTMRVPASMTKIMTAYIIFQELEKGTIAKDTLFTISDNAKRMSADKSYPTAVPLAGRTISVDQLIKNIMVPSASASCVVAAENISGSEAAFVKRMNATAKTLGMDAAYQNCHGAKVHYVSAKSIAILIKAFIEEYPEILNYTSLKSITYNGKVYNNTNKLLSSYHYEGADGFKTGTIAQAGYCLSATAERNGRRMITVVMNSFSTKTRHTDSIKLLDYGFAEANRRDVSRANAVVSLDSGKISEVRIGADTPVTASFTNVSRPFENEFYVLAGAETAGNFKARVSQNGSYIFIINLDENFAGQEAVNVTAGYQDKNGVPHEGRIVMRVSSQKPSPFKDTAYHWAGVSVEEAYEKGFVNGYGNGKFLPDGSISRAEFVTIMSAMTKYGEEQAEAEPAFADVNGHWASDAIYSMAAWGFVQGNNGNFRPDDRITRQEAAVIICRMLEAGGTEGMKGAAFDFADGALVADWAKDAVAAVSKGSLMNGYEDGTFRPKHEITRAESVVTLLRALPAMQ